MEVAWAAAWTPEIFSASCLVVVVVDSLAVAVCFFHRVLESMDLGLGSGLTG